MPRVRCARLPVASEWLAAALLGVLLLGVAGCGRTSRSSPLPYQELSPGISYAHERIPKEPWSIHVVRVERNRPDFQIQTLPAPGRGLGLVPLSEQLRGWPAARGVPVAAINGDFYERDGPFAGDPRGLQIVDGEFVSRPSGGVAVWAGPDHRIGAGPISARWELTWPNGSRVPVELNATRSTNALALYSPTAVRSTHTATGPEWILEGTDPASARLTPGTSPTLRVVEVRQAGNTPLRPGVLVLSADPRFRPRVPPLAVGDTVRLSLTTEPPLPGVTAAIGGGPVLVHQGRPQKIQPPSEESYVFSSMLERHPRSAVGWDDQYLYLVTVDGRQEGVSVGMSLDELAAYLAGLGAQEAITLDGGGSATLWCEGQVRNSPCDGEERPVANVLMVVRSPAPPPR